MKKTILSLLLVAVIIASNAQSKKDSAKLQEPQDTLVQITFSLVEYKMLYSLINKSEESHKIVNYYLELFNDKKRVELKLAKKKQ